MGRVPLRPLAAGLLRLEVVIPAKVAVVGVVGGGLEAQQAEVGGRVNALTRGQQQAGQKRQDKQGHGLSLKRGKHKFKLVKSSDVL